MRRKEGRTIGLYFKVSPAEMALIEGFSFRLTAPYSAERRQAASEAAKAHSVNLSRHVHKDVL